MIGAFLLSEPPGCRNRNLFQQLVRAASSAEPDESSAVLVSSIALDDSGNRAKVGSISAPLKDVLAEVVSLMNPYPKSIGRGQIPIDHYSQPLVDNPVFEGMVPIDLFGIGTFEVNTVPSRNTCVYSALTGTTLDLRVYGEASARSVVPGDLLVRMSLDDDTEVNFINKARRNMLDALEGRYAAQVISVGPDPLLVLMRRGWPLYLYLMAHGNSFYVVWSDYQLPKFSSDVYVWPLDVFDRGSQDLVLGFSLRMLRTKWVRWMTPKFRHRMRRKESTDHHDMMTIPRAISALQEWMYRHSA